MSRIIVISLCLAYTLAFGGDAADLHFIGFSEDGKYLAFEQYGIQDGSGFAYAEIILVNVPENSFAYPAITCLDEDQDMGLDMTCIRAQTQARSKLEALSIVEGNLGEHVISHPLSDLEANPKYVRFYERATVLPGFSGFREYGLTLKELEIPSDNDYLYGFGPPKMLELSINIPGIDEDIVLQKDTKLPKRRSNVLGYRIHDVYIYHYQGQKYIAVFISYTTPGFEGPDLRFMVVTANLDF
jgi:predicted secreted protein